MSIEIKDIDKLSKLSRLQFEGSSKEGIANELSKIMEFVSQLQECDTDGIEPMASTVASVSTYERDDEVTGEDRRDDFMENSPKEEMGFFVVPRVIE